MPAYETNPSVVCTVLDDGGVLLNLETKFYYSLNRTGLAVWMLLEDGHGDPGSVVSARFPEIAENRSHVDTFLAGLDRERLISPRTNGAGTGPTSAIEALAAWEAPSIRKHDVPLSQILSNPFDPCVPLAE